MISWSPQSYIPSFVKIGLPVLEKKIFEWFLPYMSVVAILVMWPRCCEQNFVPPTQGGSTLNMALISQVVSEKMFEHCERQTTDHGYTISSPMSRAKNQLKIVIITAVSELELQQALFMPVAKGEKGREEGEMVGERGK